MLSEIDQKIEEMNITFKKARKRATKRVFYLILRMIFIYLTFLFLLPFEFQFITTQFDYNKHLKEYDNFILNLVHSNKGNFPIPLEEFRIKINEWYQKFDEIKDLNDISNYSQFAFDIVNYFNVYKPDEIKKTLYNMYGVKIK